jgi:REP element-mobilizing transposase RayT
VIRLSRPLPKVRAGGWYHVVNRGADESVLFPTSHAKEALIADLNEVAYDFAVEIHAYCVMETHYHLLARGLEPELRQAIVRLEAGVPVPTEGARFRRMAVGRHLLQVTRYIHRNPIDAGLVRLPGEWEWSSYRGYLDPLDGPPWLRSSIVLGWLGSIGARQLYRRYCERSTTFVDI